jgi:hypothetical protein
MAGLESLGGEDADRSIQADVAAAFARWQAEKSR